MFTKRSYTIKLGPGQDIQDQVEQSTKGPGQDIQDQVEQSTKGSTKFHQTTCMLAGVRSLTCFKKSREENRLSYHLAFIYNLLTTHTAACEQMGGEGET